MMLEKIQLWFRKCTNLTSIKQMFTSKLSTTSQDSCNDDFLQELITTDKIRIMDISRRGILHSLSAGAGMVIGSHTNLLNYPNSNKAIANDGTKSSEVMGLSNKALDDMIVLFYLRNCKVSVEIAKFLLKLQSF